MTAAPDLLEDPVRDEVARSEPSQNLSPAEKERRGLKLVGKPARGERNRAWDPEEFAQQQILGLIQKVFCPGWPHPARQVVFSCVDDLTDIGRVFARVSLTMAERLPGTVCAIEADTECRTLRRLAPSQMMGVQLAGTNAPCKVRDNLWLLSSQQFRDSLQTSAARLRARLSELRREFDYVVIHGSPVTTCSQTALIGQLADGVILVLDEQKTRRAAAREAKAILQSFNARLLGIVLSDRVFPIPEIIYRRL